MPIDAIFYSPTSLLNTFNNSLSQDTAKRIFQMKGVYIAGKGTNYNNFYYDTLKDENSDTCMSLILPGIIRSKLRNQELIEFTAFLTKKIQFSSGKIDLQVNLVELQSQNKSTHTEEEIKTFEILQNKAQIGYKDVDSFIKKRIIDNQAVTIKIIIGKNAIIDSDIKHQLQEAVSFYDIEFIKISLASESEIIYSINKYSKECDIIVISRGGGENMTIFNNIFIAEQAIHLKCIFVTAIGHKEDISLLQKIADKAFITPTALGQYLREIYNSTIEELQNSKAHLVKQITTQLEGQYKQQVENYRQWRNADTEKINLLTFEVKTLQQKTSAYKKKAMLLFILLILLAAVIGLLIAVRLFK